MLRSFAVSFDHDSTMPEHDYRKLLRRTLMGMALCIAAVLVYYFWIDRPVAFFVYHHQINKFQVFRWLTYPPPELQTWSPLVLTVLMVRRAWGPFVRWQKVLLVGPMTTHRSLATVGMVFIRFSVATTSVAFRPATPAGSWASPRCG